VIAGSAGVEGAFDRTGDAAGSSRGAAGVVSWANAIDPKSNAIAPRAMNFRKSMKKKPETEKPATI
jgi:hypothetical protein